MEIAGRTKRGATAPLRYRGISALAEADRHSQIRFVAAANMPAPAE